MKEVPEHTRNYRYLRGGVEQCGFTSRFNTMDTLLSVWLFQVKDQNWQIRESRALKITSKGKPNAALDLITKNIDYKMCSAPKNRFSNALKTRLAYWRALKIKLLLCSVDSWTYALKTITNGYYSNKANTHILHVTSHMNYCSALTSAFLIRSWNHSTTAAKNASHLFSQFTKATWPRAPGFVWITTEW